MLRAIRNMRGCKLRRYVFVLCVCVMFLGVVLTGCLPEPEPKPEYITVTVQARANANIRYKRYDGSLVSTEPLAGATVRIEIWKAGGENAIFNRETDSGGLTEMVAATFNVYKEQPVDVIAWITAIKGEKVSGSPIGKAKFTWQDIWWAAGGFGESCTFSPTIYVYTDVLREEET